MAQPSFEIHGSCQLLSFVLLFQSDSYRCLTDQKRFQRSFVWFKKDFLFAKGPPQTDLDISRSGFNSKYECNRINFSKFKHFLSHKETNWGSVSSR